MFTIDEFDEFVAPYCADEAARKLLRDMLRSKHTIGEAARQLLVRHDPDTTQPLSAEAIACWITGYEVAKERYNR